VHNGLSRSYGRRELSNLLSMCDRVIFCADHLRVSTERRLGRSDERFTVVPNGVDELFLRASRTRPSDFNIVFAGNLSPEKGAHVMLEAVAELENMVGAPPASVTIVGASNYGNGGMDAYERQLRSMADRLRSPVEFMGWTSRHVVAEIFGRAGAVCVPSVYDEPFGLVVLEALASRTPVAVSDAPGPLEVIEGVGRVHHKADALGLADDLFALSTDNELWQQLSDAGAARARSFTWDAAIRGIIDS
jgi:glycosyltransferase involved in cell wall biosynthesis